MAHCLLNALHANFRDLNIYHPNETSYWDVRRLVDIPDDQSTPIGITPLIIWEVCRANGCLPYTYYNSSFVTKKGIIEESSRKIQTLIELTQKVGVDIKYMDDVWLDYPKPTPILCEYFTQHAYYGKKSDTGLYVFETYIVKL